MNFKVTTLCENHIGHGGKNLIGEHGLSFYVEADDRCILFDTGQNLAIANNAEVLGIDLGRIDTVILSHGHYDHSSGLKSLLDCNTNFTLCAHPDVFDPKLRGAGDKHKYIEIPFKNDFEAVETDFYLEKGDDYPADTLADDRALILDTDKGLVVLLGCSHRGVVNTLNHVTEITGRQRIHAIMGGLHLGKASDEKLLKIVDHLDAFGLEKIGVGHCTGPKAFVALANEFKERVFLNTVGNVMEF